MGTEPPLPGASAHAPSRGRTYKAARSRWLSRSLVPPLRALETKGEAATPSPSRPPKTATHLPPTGSATPGF